MYHFIAFIPGLRHMYRLERKSMKTSVEKCNETDSDLYLCLSRSRHSAVLLKKVLLKNKLTYVQ